MSQGRWLGTYIFRATHGNGHWFLLDSYLLALWVDSKAATSFASPHGQTKLRQLGIQFKTHVLGYELHKKLTAGKAGYRSEVQFQRHSTTMSKKAAKATRIMI